MADGPSFPPASWLGAGLDMTTTTPCDITAVTQSTLHNVILLKVPKGGDEYKFPGDVAWTVPKGVNVSKDVNTGRWTTISYDTGSKASTTLQADANLAATYLALSGSVNIGYSINKTFQSTFQYSLSNFSQNQLQVNFEDVSAQLDDAKLSKFVKRLKPFDTNDKTIKAYKSFFSTLGTHIITGASYGSRLQLMVWASNSDENVSKSFNANVSVAFSGLTTSGEFDASVKHQDEYHTFERSMQKTCSCMGGDASLATTISSDPTDKDVYHNYKAWVASAQHSPNIMKVQTIAIWDLVYLSNEADVAERSNDISTAYKYIIDHPQPHVTKCRFVIGSDWGEVGLLTPSATIEKDPDSTEKLPTDNLVMSSTKILWGREYSHDYHRQTIDFVIRNDGSPVDIALSHGSSGSQEGSGECRVTIAKKEYKNVGETDNNWNTRWFYQCETNPNESSSFADVLDT